MQTLDWNGTWMLRWTDAAHRLCRLLFREMQWPRAEVRVRREDGSAVFECDTYAWNVCIDLDGDRGISDNFFDLFPGVPHVIPWSADAAPRIHRVGNSLVSWCLPLSMERPQRCS